MTNRKKYDKLDAAILIKILLEEETAGDGPALHLAAAEIIALQREIEQWKNQHADVVAKYRRLQKKYGDLFRELQATRLLETEELDNPDLSDDRI